ncbi:ABC transporter permease [Paenibacillus roseipurpureus]|uniref:ABC transporter permease subunit n=1 Tax=Paenibacillus roseopurpureus TaxID=2918901 RepID=A0AA96RH77_9BACL|nr:ABC transporter permease subunit [Paenibacillus sp. MBLB1832]WNR43023.1 ABC transporter permease subunit [Paenibacillus sp. MBLB1832]
MESTGLTTQVANVLPPAKTTKLSSWQRGIPLYFMILPGFLFFSIFKYIPMAGVLLAFKDYDPFIGLWGSKWVGLEHFQRLFTSADFLTLMWNTLALSAVNLFFFFPAPIILAILLNEIRLAWFRKSIQTIVYIPHFLSWVIVISVTFILFATQEGGVNKLLVDWGFPRFELLTSPDYFRPLYLSQNIWKETGWNAVIFFAALASIDPTLYEASVVDGASRMRQLWHITLPALKQIIIILFILRVGYVMNTGFEHILLMQNPLNLGVADVFDTYVYREGILQGQFSFTTAVGLFKSVIGLALIVVANWVAKKLGEEGVY